MAIHALDIRSNKPKAYFVRIDYRCSSIDHSGICGNLIQESKAFGSFNQILDEILHTLDLQIFQKDTTFYLLTSPLYFLPGGEGRVPDRFSE
jgi:hypothetical protein